MINIPITIPKRPRLDTTKGQSLILFLMLSGIFVLLIILIVNLTVLVQGRIKTQNGTDATSLSASVSYSRGLNILAASNRVLVVAATFDALTLAISGTDPKTRLFVISAQNTFIKVWPPIMETQAFIIAERNHLRLALYPLPPSPVIVWNVGGANPSLIPALNVKRRTLWDIVSGIFAHEVDRHMNRYSYRDKDGKRHYFSPGEVEQSGEYSSGKKRYRVKPKGGPGHKGKFVRKEVAVEEGASIISILRSLGKDILSKIEADVIDKEPDLHNVMVYANRHTGFRFGAGNALGLSGKEQRLQHALAQAGAREGTLNFWKPNCGCYQAYLEPVNVSGLATDPNLKIVLELISEHAILH